MLKTARMLKSIQPPVCLLAARTNRWFYPLVFIVSILLLTVIWTTPLSIKLWPLQKELLRGYASFMVLGTAYITAFWYAEDRLITYKVWVIVASAVCLVVLVITLHYLDKFPQLNRIDELHNWHVQWTYANTGLLGEAMYRQMIDLPQPIIDTPHYVMGWLLRYIGDTFWQSRFARLLMACIALPFIYLCGAMMYGKRTGLFAVVFAALLIPPTSYVRPDVFVGVMLSIALYVYWRAQATHRPLMHFFTGLCVALAGEGHPLAYRFGLAFALIYFVRWFYEMRTTRRLFFDGRIFALGMGGITGMLIYLSIHILPNMQQGLHFAGNYSVAAQRNQWEAALFIIRGQLDVWASTSPIEFMLFLVGIVWAIRDNKQADRLLLTLLLFSEGLLLLTYGYYRQFYQAHFLPIFALLIGRVVANLTAPQETRQSAGRMSTLYLAGIIGIVSVLVLVQNAHAASNDPERDEFTAIAQRLKADLPADVIIVGNENYMLAMRSLNYFGIQTITTPNWYIVKYQGDQLWNVTNPDIFILSGKMDTAKYTDLPSIWRYMGVNNFKLARCYTQTGLIKAYVYVRKMPKGWQAGDVTCEVK